MDNDVILSQFDEIEEKVQFLIELCKSLETTNNGLKSRIELLEQEVADKSEAEKKYVEQKEKVRRKIDGLLNKLNDFTDSSS